MPKSSIADLRRLSSRKTFFYKKVFPTLWFGFLLIFSIIMIALKIEGGYNQPPLFMLAMPIIMMGLGYLLMRKLTFDLMDDVYDAEEGLIVRRGHEEERIFFANIININHSQMINPCRVTLTLRQDCRFGKTVVFCPIVSSADIRSFGFTNAIADELVERVEAARRAH